MSVSDLVPTAAKPSPAVKGKAVNRIPDEILGDAALNAAIGLVSVRHPIVNVSVQSCHCFAAALKL